VSPLTHTGRHRAVTFELAGRIWFQGMVSEPLGRFSINSPRRTVCNGSPWAPEADELVMCKALDRGNTVPARAAKAHTAIVASAA